nr:MAG TPA: hypothetical protein [Caudoviricetes sp.]
MRWEYRIVSENNKLFIYGVYIDNKNRPFGIKYNIIPYGTMDDLIRYKKSFDTAFDKEIINIDDILLEKEEYKSIKDIGYGVLIGGYAYIDRCDLTSKLEADLDDLGFKATYKDCPSGYDDYYEITFK